MSNLFEKTNAPSANIQQPLYLVYQHNAKGNDPLANLDGYSNNVLTLYCLVHFAREPTICKSDEFNHSAYDSIINIDSNSELGESRWTLIDVILNHFGSYLTSYREGSFLYKKMLQVLIVL